MSQRLWAVRMMMALISAQATAQTQPATRPSDESIGVAIYVGEELIRDYRPQSTVINAQTKVERPKYPAIDIHCHWSSKVEPQFLIDQMNKLGVSHAVNLSGGSGEELMAMLERYTRFSDRLIIFANLDFDQIDDEQFGAKMAAMLEQAHARGARGLKLFKSFGLTVRTKDGQRVKVDDPRLDAVWATCARLRMPVLIHSADPVAFFRPSDVRNERLMQLLRHPSWSFFGPQFPGWDEVIAERNRLIARHPQTMFIVAHMGEGAHDYQALSRWLDEMPNMHVDISGRENEIGRQPRASKAFFEKYADRILFGTDRYPGRPDQPRYTIYYRMLETEDEYFDYYDHPFPPAGEWKIYGLGLSDETLRKIYRDNAARLLGLSAVAQEQR